MNESRLNFVAVCGRYGHFGSSHFIAATGSKWLMYVLLESNKNVITGNGRKKNKNKKNMAITLEAQLFVPVEMSVIRRPSCIFSLVGLTTESFTLAAYS